MATKVKIYIGIVCPICGTVYKEGLKIAQTEYLSDWEHRGYRREICPDCVGKPVGRSGEFHFGGM